MPELTIPNILLGWAVFLCCLYLAWQVKIRDLADDDAQDGF